VVLVFFKAINSASAFAALYKGAIDCLSTS